jgi:hypothetical protein
MVIVSPRSAHTREVVAIRRKLRTKVDLFINVWPREITYLLWAIFLDARDFFAHQQVGLTEQLPESQLRCTTNFLGVGRIPMDIMGVPLEQSGATHPRGDASTNRTADSTLSSGDSLFRPAEYISHKNSSISDDISAITTPLVEKFPYATTEALMAHGDLRYDDIRIGNKGACLNYNLFGVCKDKTCSYCHTAKAKPTAERIKAVADKLKPAIQSFMAAGAPSSQRKRKHSST